MNNISQTITAMLSKGRLRPGDVIYVSINDFRKIIDIGEGCLQGSTSNGELIWFSNKWKLKIMKIIPIDDGVFIDSPGGV